MEKRIGTFDLGAFGDEIEENGPHRRLGGIIRRLISLHSIFTDLDTAADTFAVLREVTREPAEEGDQRRLMVEASLLHSAIVLYARATKSTSRERAGFDIRSRLSADELVVHTEICDLRDQAVAHFGSGGSYRGQWKAEKAYSGWKGMASALASSPGA